MAELKHINIPAVKMVPVKDLKMDGKNPNAMDPKQFEALKEGIKRFGFIVPVITNKDLLMADGEHRWRAAKHLKMKEIPAVILDVTEVDRRLIRQVMYRVKGEHDNLMDREEIHFLLAEEDNSLVNHLLGTDDQELIKILEDGGPPEQRKRTLEIKVTHTCPKCSHKWSDKKRGEK